MEALWLLKVRFSSCEVCITLNVLEEGLEGSSGERHLLTGTGQGALTSDRCTAVLWLLPSFRKRFVDWLNRGVRGWLPKSSFTPALP